MLLLPAVSYVSSRQRAILENCYFDIGVQEILENDQLFPFKQMLAQFSLIHRIFPPVHLK